MSGWQVSFFTPEVRLQLIRIAHRLGARDSAEAIEAADAGWAAVAKNRDRIDEPFPWVRRAIANFIIKERKKRDRRGHVPLDEDTLGDSEAVECQELGKLEASDWVNHILSSLSRDQRRVMEMYLEGLSPTDIAAQLKVSPNAVRNRIFRARATLMNHAEITVLRRRRRSGRLPSFRDGSASGRGPGDPPPVPTSSGKENP